MTYIFNDPTRFLDELRDGIVAAHGDLVTAVPGGVIRAEESPEGQVAVVTGGGSGHYPAFAGIVGHGLAHGAAMGNIFASPSAKDVYTVAKAAHGGGGVLLTYGNYAGDVLNFDQAEERLQAEGIACRTVTVTDDISSAPPEERHKRRGVAGDLVVFKVAGAAAEAGCSLDEVWELATRANDRTRTMGVAFSGCTLPGAGEPLFTVAPGRMGVGMGIHGEPGISEEDIPHADELAAMLTARLLTEVPEGNGGGSRVAVILNGLGAVKYEELFVLYSAVARELTDAGLVVVEPEVGELVTSFQMAGVSLTLCWLDDELERLWAAPAYAPAYRKGRVTSDRPRRARAAIATAVEDVITDAAPDSRQAADLGISVLEAIAQAMDAASDELGRIDAVAGDGDHGIGMQRGSAAAAQAARAAAVGGAGLGTLLERAGDGWADQAGGTSGALWGMILRSLGSAVGDQASPTSSSVAAGVAAAADDVQRHGGAKLGDKTLLDVLRPFSRALAESSGAGVPVAEAWQAAVPAALRAAEATADLLPRIGRARPHAYKSLGTPDAGAQSMALIITTVSQVLNERGRS